MRNTGKYAVSADAVCANAVDAHAVRAHAVSADAVSANAVHADAGQEEEADDGLAQAYIMDDIKIQMVRAATCVGFQNPDCWASCQYDDFGNMISASGEKGKAWWRYDDQGKCGKL